MKLYFILLITLAITNAAIIRDSTKNASEVNEKPIAFDIIWDLFDAKDSIDTPSLPPSLPPSFPRYATPISTPEKVISTETVNKSGTEDPPEIITSKPFTAKRYQIVPYIKANWLISNMYCRSIGMSLISISSMEEHNAIIKTIKDAGLTDENFWTTGRRIDGTMYWFESGQKFNFTNWGEGEPNNKYGREECIGIYEYVKLKWNDFNCEERLHIMCEENGTTHQDSELKNENLIDLSNDKKIDKTI